MSGGSVGDQDDSKLREDVCKGLVFSLHLSATGSVTRFEGSKEFLEKLSEIDSAEAKKLKAVAGEDFCCGSADPDFRNHAGGHCRKGANLATRQRCVHGPDGQLRLATTFTYAGFKDGGEQISTRAAFSWQPSKVDPGALGASRLRNSI